MDFYVKEKEKIVFPLKIEENLANAIRRYLGKIYVLGIDEVEISKNDSPLYDETIAHRLGLIPLINKGQITEKTEGKLKLKVKKEGTIYSEDLQGEVKPAYEKMPISILKKGQELDITGFAKAGKGSEHSKFLPGLMFYRNGVEVKTGKNISAEMLESCLKSIFKLEDGKMILENPGDCEGYENEVDKMVPMDELIITVESFGQFNVEELFRKSVTELKKDLADFSRQIAKAK